MKRLSIFFLAVLLWTPLVEAYQPPPISVSAFGIYGSPVQPQGFAAAVKDAAGFEALGEWNPIGFASLGLSYETTTFFSSPTASVFQAASLEGRLFPLENGKGKFSPYVMGAAGLDLGAEGNVVLKAGLGSRVSFIGPTYLDVMVGSHWVQAPGAFQYVDARLGMGFTFDLAANASASKSAEQAPASSSQPAPKAAPAPAPTAAPTQPAPAVATPTVAVEMPSPTTTPEVLSLEEPATATAPASMTYTGSAKNIRIVQKYYKLGMRYFAAGNKAKTNKSRAADYSASLKYLQRSLKVKEVHGAPYYYAETYATIGVIYHFHSTLKSHRKLALINYQKALKIDPTTKAAKKYIKLLKAPPKKTVHKPRPTPAASSDSGSSMTIDTGASSSGSSGAGNGTSSSSGSSAPAGSSDSSGSNAPATTSTGGKIIDNN